LAHKNSAFISRFFLHVENVHFFDRVGWKACLRDGSAFVSLSKADRIVETVVFEGEEGRVYEKAPKEGRGERAKGRKSRSCMVC